MGPPIYIGGNRDILIMQLFKIRYASMGPPIYIGGNKITSSKSSKKYTGILPPGV